MFTHTRALWLLLVLATVSLIGVAAPSPPAGADPGHGMVGSDGHHRGSHDFVGRALHSLLRHRKDLNLSEEQVTKIKAIATDYAKTRIRDKAEVQLAEVDVHALVMDDKAELADIEAALRKSESARTALRLERAKAMRAARAVLTPEQREQWRATMRERYRSGGHGREPSARLDPQDASGREG